MDRSVSRLPILVGVDCFDHLGFDLTHESEESEDFAVRVGCVPFPSHATNIGHFGSGGENGGQFSRWHNSYYTEPLLDCMLDVLSHHH